MVTFKTAIESVGTIIDALGVVVIVGGMVVAAVHALRPAARRDGTGLPGERPRYRVFRQDLGRAILLGLEFLVAGDIIRTVAVAPTLENVLVLAIIVVIRTALSFSLEVELEGRWPWSARGRKQEGGV